MKIRNSILLFYAKQFCPLLFIMLLNRPVSAYAQECQGGIAGKDSIWVQSAKSGINLFTAALPDTGTQGNYFAPDSLKNRLLQKGDTTRSSFRKLIKQADTTMKQEHRLISFEHGYVQYNMNYRSRIDTPYAENDILQHLGMANGQFVIAGLLPVSVTYIERQSNSSLFADYRDVRADIDGPALQRLQQEKLRQGLLQQIRKLEDSAVLSSLNREKEKMAGFTDVMNNPKLVEILIQSKENIINIHEHDVSCKWTDSVSFYSKRFIDLYESERAKLNEIENKVDSLEALYASARRKIQTIQKIINGHFNTGEGIALLKKRLYNAGIDESMLPAYPGILYSLQRLSIGRTMPDYSPLTLKNINVKGINAEFGNGIWYAAFTAGIVDFRIRDFVVSKIKQSPQYVYAVKAGWGRKEGNHLYVTGYKGKKQIYSLTEPSAPVTGVSTELQYVIGKDHRFSAEIAQSSVPSPAAQRKTSVFDLKDLTGRAYHLGWSSYFPALKAGLQGFYQKTGVNFQSFNGYRVNAAAESWMLKYNQYFFGRQLRIDAAVRKNDFTNPLIAQSYNSNTVFKTLQATFKKRYWPSVSVGYIPSSQYAVIDSQVYESRYQTLTVNMNHSYKIGTARAITNAFYSRFYNSGSDSGFVYYNANYISMLEEIVFKLHSALIGVNITRNSQFTLEVYQIGTSSTLFRKLQGEMGVKINHFSGGLTKAGMYGRMKLMIPWIGDLSAWYDDSYLPGTGQQLVRNEQVNIGFARRIK